MYKIIGADQKEYGPVSGEQLRQWIAEGRVSGQTMVQSESDPNWRPLSTFGEFAASFATAPPALAGQYGYGGGDTRARALSLVKGPAIALMITAGLGIICQVLVLVIMMVGMIPQSTSGTGDPEMERMFSMLAGGVGVVMRAVGILAGIFVFIGAWKMQKLEKYGLCMAATIVAMVPCISPCCLLGLPFGIWALVVLCKPEVKGNFS